MSETNFAKKTKRKKNEPPPEPILQRDVVVGTCQHHGDVKVWVEEAIPPVDYCHIQVGLFDNQKLHCNYPLSLRLVRKPHHVSAA